MIPGNYDFTIVRGTTQPFAVRITTEDPDNPPNRIPIPFTEMIMSVKTGGTTLHKSTNVPGSGFVYDDTTNVATWTPTPAESRALKVTPPDGAAVPNTYELEVWNGPSQMVYLTGSITAIGGINSDEAEVP